MMNSFIAHLIGQSPLLSRHGKTVLVFPEVLVLFAAIWFLWKRRPAIAKAYHQLPSSFRLAGALLILGGAISVAVSGSLLSAFAAYKAWIIFPMLMFFLFTVTPRGGWYARVALYAAAGLELLYSLVSASGHSSNWRLLGTFSSPNYLAMLLGPVLVLLVLDLLRSKARTRDHTILIIAIVCTAVGLLATKSVGSIVGVGGAGLYCLYRAPLRREMRRALGVVILVLGLIGGVLLIGRVQVGQANSVSSRLQIWHTAAVLGSQQPLTGIGFTNFPQRYADTVVSVIGHPPIEWEVPLPHDIYLAFWLYTGVLGLAGLFAVIGEVCKKEYGLLFLPFLTLCIHGLVDTPYFYTPIVYVFWLTLAIGLIDVWQKRQIIFFESSKR